MPDTDNGRVTMAVLSTKLDSITDLLTTHITKGEINDDKHEVRLHSLDINMAKLETRQSTFAWLVGGLSIIGNAIAAYIGIR